MPERKTLQRAARDKREGKAPSTQAGEFVREEIHHVREGAFMEEQLRSPPQRAAATKRRTSGSSTPQLTVQRSSCALSSTSK